MFLSRYNSPPKKRFDRGVILLTCMVFLLVLLSMLRFTVTSSRLEEQKASIDLDLTLARESSRSVFNYVEYYLLKQGEAYCLLRKEAENVNCQQEAASYLSQLMRLPSETITQLDLPTSDNLPPLKALWQQGFYTGDYLNEHYPQCQPLWICVSWGREAKQAEDAADDQRRQAKIKLDNPLKTLECLSCNNSGERVPRFVVERLLPNELTLAEADQKTLDNVVILRVTALGFGRGDAKDSQLSNLMMQGTYALY
ncbi:MAG: hypothetical protein Q4B71_07230 [Cardiobacteriaceae bacterium]|nr:hypothetical protein [Cardiobacteriaceae bacterium]